MPATDLNSLARTLAERLIRKVALETLTLAELRATIEMPEPDWTVTDAADDAIGVMLGEDWGCLDPEDPEDAAKILKFVNECEAVIREAIEKTLEEARNVACVACKYNWPIEPSWPGERGTYHRNDNGPNTTIVKCNADAIRSLKPVAIQK